MCMHKNSGNGGNGKTDSILLAVLSMLRMIAHGSFTLS